MKFLFFDETGTLRSGFRALIFLLSFTFVAVVLGTVAQAVLAAMKIDAAQNSGLYLVVNGTLSLIPAIVIGWLSGKLLENMPFRALGGGIYERLVSTFHSRPYRWCRYIKHRRACRHRIWWAEV